MTKKVAIQGQEGSFHYIAAMEFFGEDVEIVDCEVFKDTFSAVKAGRADYAVCAIENSLYGTINATYDLLVDNDFAIMGELYLRVEQNLIGLPGTKISEIERVYSHPVALVQCEDYLSKNVPTAKRLEFHDTAASVGKVKEMADKTNAAIGSTQAAELYGMEILAESIETNKQNYTRFIILSPKAEEVQGRNKTSLILKTSHKPGALYAALGAFAAPQINLSKLQSRPIIGKAWHYIFYVDVDADIDDLKLVEALGTLKAQGCEVKVLGSYVSAKKV
jgi:prephenate dehydratase